MGFPIPYELFIALRYLKGSRRTLGGNLTSVIAIGGVTVGVAALITTLAVMTGFREDIRSKILGTQPHLLVQPLAGSVMEERDYSDRFTPIPEVTAWAPFILGQALIRGGEGTQGVVVKGVDSQREPHVTGLDTRVIYGHWSDLSVSSGTSPVFLGKELAKNLGVTLGDKVILAVSGGDDLVSGGLPAFYPFLVVGVLRTGLYDYDSNLVVVSLPVAQKIFHLKGRVSGLGVRLTDPDDFEGPSLAIQGRFSSEALVRSWLGMNRPLFSALQLEKVVMFLILTLITLVAAFTILSNLLLVTAQRVREIGILRAMGATPGAIQRIFLLKGLVMGVVGTGTGTALGLTLAWVLKHYEFIKLPADVYYVERLPVMVVGNDVVLVGLAALAIVLLATIYPARLAARLDALDAVRRL